MRIPVDTPSPKPLTRGRRAVIAFGSLLIIGVSYLVLGLAHLLPTGLWIIRKAACDANAGTCAAPGLGGITTAADALLNPVIVGILSIAPFALAFGFGAIMVGSRRGMMIAGGAIIGAILVVGTKGIVA